MNSSRASVLATAVLLLGVVAACSSELSAEAKAACAMASAPISSEADRVAFRTRAQSLSPDEVKPNNIGQRYFVLREASLQASASDDFTRVGLEKFQRDLASVCKAEGYSP